MTESVSNAAAGSPKASIGDQSESQVNDSSSDSSLASDGTASLQRAVFGPSSPSLSTASTMSSLILRPITSPTSPPTAPDSAAEDDTLLDYQVKSVHSTLDAPRKYVMVTAAGDIMDVEQIRRLLRRSIRSRATSTDGTLRLPAPAAKEGYEAGSATGTAAEKSAVGSPIVITGMPEQPPSPPSDPTKTELLPDPSPPPTEPVTSAAPPTDSVGQPAPVLVLDSAATTPLPDPTPLVSSISSSSEEKQSPRLYMTPSEQSSAADSNERIWREVERACDSPTNMSEASSTTRRFANAGWLPGSRGDFRPSLHHKARASSCFLFYWDVVNTPLMFSNLLQ